MINRGFSNRLTPSMSAPADNVVKIVAINKMRFILGIFIRSFADLI